MKWSPPGPHFGEQVNDLTRIFLGWNTCEQTIVLYALMRKIPTAQAKFLSRTIQHHLESLTDLNNLETNANNPVFIKSLQSESTEVALHQLLTHLPLLRPDNADCKDCYLTVITEVASACTSTGQYTEQIQQLLSYTLIHPAIASQDRGGLSQFLRVLEARIISTPIDEYTRLSSSRWDGTCLKSSASSKQQQQQQHQHQQQQQQQQSQGKFNNSYNLHTGVINLGRQSPPSSCASSGSEGRLDIASSQKFTSNIGNMMVWLKSLRLHKYSYLFTTMCYEDMLNLTEDQLADKGVTQGARHKLALSIQKLHERYSILINLEKKLSERPVDGCNFRSFTQESALLASALEELNAILSTPIYRCKDQDDAQDRPEHDIPAQFVQVLCKLCSRLSPETSDEQIICGCINILEKVLQHECFTMEQKEMVQPWHSGLGSPRIMQKMQHGGYSYIRRFNPPAHSRKPSSHMNIGHVYNHQQANPMIGHHRDSFSQQYGHHGLGQSIIMNANYTTAKRSSLQETRIEHPQRPLQRTNSAPRDHFLSQSSTTSPVVVEPTDPELNSRLESLCLRMTEQAIGGFGEA